MGTVQSHYKENGKTKVVWKWEYKPGDFRLYSPEASALIEKHYLSNSSSLIQISGINLLLYQIDLKEMFQINIISKSKRKIRRDIQRDSHNTIRWSWENDSHEMQFYSLDLSNKIEVHFQKEDTTPLKVSIFERQYLIDPLNKFQLNTVTKNKRKIERNTVPGEKYIWQWQQEDGDFINYSGEDSARIEAIYSYRKKEPYKLIANGVEYLVDPEKFIQMNLQTKKVNGIRRVRESYIKYGWFWQDLDGRWSPFSLYFAEKLEKNYQSASRSPLLMTINGRQYEIDTKDMVERSLESGKCYNVKREALSNDRAVWLWMTSKGYFKPFPAYISHAIETQYMLNDRTPIVCEIRTKKYQIDVLKMEKINLENKTTRKIERKIIPNIYPSELETLSKTQSKEVFYYLSTSGYVPFDWCWTQNDKISLFPASDIERNMLFGLFQFQDFETLEISRFQNQHLINYFLLERANISHYLHSADEPTLLFYLSNKNERSEEIFDKHECALEKQYSNLTEYGKGYYFTKSFKLASQHAFERNGGEDKILVCFWVLLGRIASINNEEDQKIFYNDKYENLAGIKKEPSGYDSVSGMVENEEVFILYKPERCYPLYIIEYKDHNND